MGLQLFINKRGLQEVLVVKKFIRRNLAIVLMLMFVCVSATASVFAVTYESEPNNGPEEESNVITVNETVKGEVSAADDMYDYFVINAKTTGTIKLNFTADSKNKYLSLSVMGWGDNAFGNYADKDFEFSSDKKASYTFQITKGNKYYIVPWIHSLYEDPVPDSNTASYTFSTKFVAEKTSIRKATPGKKSFKVSWKKVPRTAYYQIRYVSKSAYRSSGWKKAKTIKAGKSTTAKTIKGLGRKKTYYVQVRTVKNIEGKTYYSSWSSKKAVKTK